MKKQNEINKNKNTNIFSSDYSHERYIENYSHLLTKLWSEHLNDLKLNKDYLESFQDILKPLIAVQDPVALELAVHINSIK